MLNHHLIGIIVEISRIRRFEIPPDDAKSFVLAVKGRPLVGKTKTVEEAGDLYTRYLSRLGVNANQFRSRTITWEKDGEAASRAAGEIKTPRGIPLEDWELVKVNNRVEIATARSIKENISTVVEGPGEATAALIDDNLEGRNLASLLQYKLENRAAPFDNVPDFEVNHVSLIGSSFLANVMTLFRWDYRHASDFPSAQKIAMLYGRKVPQTKQEWQESIDGAVGEELKLIDSVVISLAEKLRSRKLITLPPRFRGSIGDKIAREMLEHQLDLIEAVKRGVDDRSLVDYEVSKYFYQHLKVNPERYFLGFNGPTPEDLGIDDLEAIGEHLKESRRSESLTTPEDTTKVA